MALAVVENRLLTELPNPVTAAIMATETNTAIRAYSMAVAPERHVTKLALKSNRVFMGPVPVISFRALKESVTHTTRAWIVTSVTDV